MTWPVFYAYLGLLGALFIATMFRGKLEMKRTIIVILLNCAISYAFSLSVDDSFWLAVFMLAVDAISAWAVMYRPAAKWQAVIGLTYVVQVFTHIGRIAAEFSTPYPNLIAYGWGLTIVAYVQLLLVAMWWGHASLVRYHGRRGDYQMAIEPRRPSLDG